jgi:hypothetical protein
MGRDVYVVDIQAMGDGRLPNPGRAVFERTMVPIYGV